MSQGIHLLYNSEIEDLYRQNTASVLSRLHEMALENPQASALEIVSGAVALYGVGDVVVDDERPAEEEPVAEQQGEDRTPEQVEEEPVAEEAPLSREEDADEHQDITSAWTEDDEDDAILRDDPELASQAPEVSPAPAPEPEPEEEEEEEVYDGPKFALNAWGLPERVDDGEEVSREERGPRRVVLEGIDE